MKYLYIILLFCSSQISKAQSCDTTFLAPDSVQLITDNVINASVKNGDTMFIAGDFHAVGRPTGSFSGISKLTGAPLRQAIWPKIAGNVNVAIKDGHGGWILGGLFNRVGDSLRNNLVWIDSAAKVKQWHPIVDGEVTSGILKDSTIYVGGNFNEVNNTARTMLAAIGLNPDASLQPLNVAIDAKVVAMALYGNNLWIGGIFDHVSGQTRNKITAIDLTTSLPIAQVTNLDTVLGIFVSAMTIADGKLFAGGVFYNIQNQANGALTPRICALSLDANTGVLQPWLADLSTNNIGNEKGVYAFDTIGSDLVMAGVFDKINNVPRSSIGIVDRIVGMVQPFSGSIINFNGSPRALTHDDSMIYVGNVNYARSASGGSFDPIKIYGVAAFNRTSGAVSTFKPVIAPVKNLGSSFSEFGVNVIINDGDNLYIGGKCKFIGGTIRNRMASFIMSKGELTSFTSNLFGDNDGFYQHRDSMKYINNMVFSQGRLFLSGHKSSNQPGSSLVACDAFTGTALVFPDSHFVRGPAVWYKLIAYGNYIYGEMDYANYLIRRFDPITLQFDPTWMIDNPEGQIVNMFSFAIHNDRLYIKTSNQFTITLVPYNLITATKILGVSIYSPKIYASPNDLNDIQFFENKAVVTGRYDQIQYPIEGQYLRYGIGMVDLSNPNQIFLAPHAFEDYSGVVQVCPMYNKVELFGDRMYTTRRDYTSTSILKNTRIYDTTGVRWFPQWNPTLGVFADWLIPFSKDTVALFNEGFDFQVLDDRPYYGMVRFHLTENLPSSYIQINAQPGQQVATGTSVIFNAIVNIGGNPTIKWFLNNQPIVGAGSGNSWQGIAGTDFLNGDTIHARLTGTFPCASSDTIWSNAIIMVVTPLSIKENTQIDFVVYPNPSSGKLFLSGFDSDGMLAIYNSIGKKVEEVKIKGRSINEVNISEYSSGNYIFKIVLRNGKTYAVLISKI